MVWAAADVEQRRNEVQLHFQGLLAVHRLGRAAGENVLGIKVLTDCRSAYRDGENGSACRHGKRHGCSGRFSRRLRARHDTDAPSNRTEEDAIAASTMIRKYKPEDLDRIKEIFARQKRAFDLPDLGNALVSMKQCYVDDETRKVVMAGFGRLQLNAYLVVDQTWRTPEERLEAIEMLEFAMIEEARAKGFDQVTAQVEPRFGRRLELLGWQRSIGCTWSKEF
jgi:hypothetical protein